MARTEEAMMSQPYLIYTDLSADVAPEIVEKYDIRLIPMGYTVGDEERVSDHFEGPEALHAFYQAQRDGKATRTTQVPPQGYKDALSPLLKEGAHILYLSLSGGLSGTYATSCLMAEQLNEKYPQGKLVSVDSLAATAGMGMLLEAAGENREAGMSLEENAAWLEANRLRVCHWFMVDDLMYLKRGGRVSATTAIMGTALNIKPILKIENDGTLSTFAKKRGIKSAVAQLTDYYAENRDPASDRVYIVHADAPERAEQLKENVLVINPNAKISTVFLCPVIGSHVGPGMCAVVHWGKR